MYFASAFAATQRGYHCLFFDAPGQGAPLIVIYARIAKRSYARWATSR
jgi:3-deoxy-D-manno-octulosonic-acid transferase